MIGRWLIRGLALTLLTLCVVVWVGSHWQAVWVYAPAENHVRYLRVEDGTLSYTETDGRGFGQWELLHGPAAGLEIAQDVYRRTMYHFAGFAYHRAAGTNPHWYVYIPMWFPTLLGTLLFWFVWRKTRTRFTGKAFPVALAHPRTVSSGVDVRRRRVGDELVRRVAVGQAQRGPGLAFWHRARVRHDVGE